MPKHPNEGDNLQNSQNEFFPFSQDGGHNTKINCIIESPAAPPSPPAAYNTFIAHDILDGSGYGYAEAMVWGHTDGSDPGDIGTTIPVDKVLVLNHVSHRVEFEMGYNLVVVYGIPGRALPTPVSNRRRALKARPRVVDAEAEPEAAVRDLESALEKGQFAPDPVPVPSKGGSGSGRKLAEDGSAATITYKNLAEEGSFQVCHTLSSGLYLDPVTTPDVHYNILYAYLNWQLPNNMCETDPYYIPNNGNWAPVKLQSPTDLPTIGDAQITAQFGVLSQPNGCTGNLCTDHYLTVTPHANAQDQTDNGRKCLLYFSKNALNFRTAYYEGSGSMQNVGLDGAKARPNCHNPQSPNPPPSMPPHPPGFVADPPPPPSPPGVDYWNQLIKTATGENWCNDLTTGNMVIDDPNRIHGYRFIWFHHPTGEWDVCDETGAYVSAQWPAAVSATPGTPGPAAGSYGAQYPQYAPIVQAYPTVHGNTFRVAHFSTKNNWDPGLVEPRYCFAYYYAGDGEDNEGLLDGQSGTWALVTASGHTQFNTPRECADEEPADPDPSPSPGDSDEPWACTSNGWMAGEVKDSGLQYHEWCGCVDPAIIAAGLLDVTCPGCTGGTTASARVCDGCDPRGTPDIYVGNCRVWEPPRRQYSSVVRRAQAAVL